MQNKKTGGQLVTCFFIDNYFLFCFFHITLDIETCHFCDTVCAYSDGLLEVSRELSSAVVGNLNLTLLSWLNRCLGVFGHRASARGDSLVNNQWLFANILKSESACNHRLFL